MRIRKGTLRRIIREAASRRSWTEVARDDSLSRAYRSGYYDGDPSHSSFGTNARNLEKGVDDPDYLKGFEDSSGQSASKVAADYKESSRIAAEKKAEADRIAQEKWEKERELLKNRRKSSDLSDSEQDRLRSEYEADKNNKSRYERIITTTMTDAMYGRRGGNRTTTVLDKKENVLLMFTRISGSGGSLGT